MLFYGKCEYIFVILHFQNPIRTLFNSMEENDNSFETMRERRTLDKVSYAEKGRFFKIRNILNLLFIIGAIIGMVSYYFVNETVAELILVICVVIKIGECMLRLIH